MLYFHKLAFSYIHVSKLNLCCFNLNLAFLDARKSLQVAHPHFSALSTKISLTSDLVYLHALSDYFKTKNRTGLDETWSIIPGGSLQNTAIVTSLTNNENKPIILTNVKEGEKHDILTLAEQKLLDPEKLLLMTDFTSSSEAELEDMFEPAFYLSLLKKAGIANLNVNQLPPGIRIVDRVSKVIGKPIKKLEPALHLLQENNELLSNLNEPTLSRFENLFKKINSFLSMDHQAGGLDN